MFFEGTGIFARAQSDEVFWYWFDSVGFAPESPGKGEWRDNSLHIERRTPRGIARHVWNVASENIRYAVSTRFAGEADFQDFIKGEYRRTE